MNTCFFKLLIVCVFLSQTLVALANQGTIDNMLTQLYLREYKAAIKLVDDALEKHPQDASLHNAAGIAYSTRARHSSMFSAPGLAKKSLKHFKEAVRLEPNNADYRMDLMSYYLAAPGIVGGDSELGKAEAEKINELDPAKGFIATSVVYHSAEQIDKVKTHYANISAEIAKNEHVLMNRALHHETMEEFETAYAVLNEITSLTPTDENIFFIYQSHYRKGFISFMSNSRIDDGIDALNSFLKDTPKDYRLAPKPWAQFRLAQLLALKGDSDAARKLMTEAKSTSQDDDLNKKIKKALKSLK